MPRSNRRAQRAVLRRWRPQASVARECSPAGLSESERGNAIVEFIGVMVILVVPAIILIVGFSAVFAGKMAAGAAARDAARVYVRSDSSALASERALSMARMAFADRGIEAEADVDVRCNANPCLTPGASISVTVTADVVVPIVGSTVTVTEEREFPVDQLRRARQ